VLAALNKKGLAETRGPSFLTAARFSPCYESAMSRFAPPFAVAFAVLAVPAGSTDTPQSFCARLAPQLGLTLTTESRSSKEPVWKTDTASIGMHLFGGTAATGISIGPIEGGDAGPLTTRDACTYTRKGVVCRIEGPVQLYMKTRNTEATLDAEKDERAEVEIRGSTVRCRDYG